MIVITLSCCPPALRGDLTKWLSEINTGVYVGQVSAKVRDALWTRVCENVGNGQATMVLSTANEQRMEFRVHNSAWRPTDFDGITLMKRPPQGKSFSDGENLSEGFSNASKRRLAARINRSRRAANTKYAFIDIETTGLNAQTDSILEIGVVLADDGEKGESKSVLIKQKSAVPEQITALTGITDELCADSGKSISEALSELTPLLEGRIAVCYNAAFDLAFLKSAYKAAGIPSPISRSLDALTLARQKIMDIESYKLETVAKQLQLAYAETHRALADSELLCKVFFKLNEI